MGFSYRKKNDHFSVGYDIMGVMISLSQETEALARRLADVQHVTIDAAIREALEARAHATGVMPEAGRPRDRSPEALAVRRARLVQHAREIAAMPVLDPRSPAEIIDDINAL
jgi:antitoxin VapB